MKKQMTILEMNNIDPFWFKDTDSMFLSFQNHTLDYNNKMKRRVFIDNGGSVLFIAHLDTVQPPIIKKYKKGRIYAQGLDDRLGACIAYKLSKMLGADLLLCDHEEEGKSTAQYQNLNKRYNWICEFDRAADDVVHYDISNQDFHDELSDVWEIGFGSFSDICFLNTDICCMNIGIGYEHAHSEDSYADLSIMNSQIKLFIDFYEDHKDIRYYVDEEFQYEEDYGFRGILGGDFADICDVCDLQYGEQIYNYCICEQCFGEMLQQTINNFN